MEQSVFERDPSDPDHKEVNPLLKLVLELSLPMRAANG